MRRRMLRLLKWFGLAVPVLVAGGLLLAPYSKPVRSFFTNAILFGTRCRRFPQAASRRDRHCSLGDAWKHAVELDVAEARASLLNRFKLVKSEMGLTLLQTPRGQYWIPEGENFSLAVMLAEQDRDLYGGSGRGVRAGDIVLDCGANVGVYTRHALDRGAALVVAIEPAPQTVACLRRTFALEIAEHRVVVYPKGVWNKDDTLPLRIRPGFSSQADTVVLNGDRTLAQVPLTTIDKLVAELALPRVDMIKMDIEGSERRALEGALATVAKFHPRLAITLEHLPDDIDKIPAILQAQWPGMPVEYGACETIANPKMDRIQPAVVFGRW